MDDPTLQDMLYGLRGFGAAPALIVADQDRLTTVSFTQLVEAALDRCNELTSAGVRQGTRVAIAGPNSPGWIMSFWAIEAAGGVAVLLDARANDDELVELIRRAGCSVALAPVARAERLRPLLTGCNVVALDGVRHGGVPVLSTVPNVEAGATAVIVYTSGTTGSPKAVPLTHRNLLSNVAALQAEGLVGPADRAMLPLPLHHIYPLTVGMLTPLSCGAAVVLTEIASGPRLVSALTSSRATILLGVPRLYAALASNLRTSLPAFVRRAVAASRWLRRAAGLCLGSLLFARLRARIGGTLRLLVCGGAALDRDDEELLVDLGWEVLTGYGLSETSPILAFNRRGEARAGTAGRPLPGTDLRIAAADGDEVGEIEARGPGIFAGYLDDPQATRAAFTGDGWFRTGDLGRLDKDDYLHIVARRTETIVLSTGKKLFPEDVEAAYGSLPPVREIAVLAREGELVALVVPDFDAIRATGASRLMERMRDTLAERGAALPSQLRLSGFAIARGPLPRTQIGKIRRHLLPALYARASEARAPSVAAALTADDQALLADPVAARVWMWLQARFPGRTLALDSSPQIDLGIDSLGWIDVTLAMQGSLQIALNDAAVARILTLRDLVREAVAAAAAQPLRAAPPSEPSRLPSFGLFDTLAHRLLYILTRAIMRNVFRARAEGIERIPDNPFVLCPNHASFLDPFAIAAVLPYRKVRRLHWSGWTGILFDTGLRRMFSRIARVLPVDPDRAAVSSLDLASAVLARGENLVWFPEGERSRDGKLGPFRPGIGLLVERTRVRVIPVRLEGTYSAWPRGRRWPRLGRITVRFGEPLAPDAVVPPVGVADRHQRAANAVRDAIARLH